MTALDRYSLTLSRDFSREYNPSAHVSSSKLKGFDMVNRRIVVLFGLVLVGAASTWSQQRGYVLKSGDGERLPGERQTFVKASPRMGTQGVELFRDSMAAGASTGIHVHQEADEFFYVISGRGFALVDGNEVPIESNDFLLIPKGHGQRVKTAGPTPLELVFLVDRPGLASDFRESRSEQVTRKRRLTLDEWNRISKKYRTVHRTLE